MVKNAVKILFPDPEGIKKDKLKDAVQKVKTVTNVISALNTKKQIEDQWDSAATSSNNNLKKKQTVVRDYDKSAKEAGIENILKAMSHTDIYEELEQFRRYKKYDEIDDSKREELMKMIKIGINPKNLDSEITSI